MKRALTVLTLVLLLSVFGFTQNLATVINALGARESTLTIFKQYAVTDDLTVPTNITLKFLQGGSVLISTTKTLTIDGKVDAGLYEIFEWAGTGKVVFGDGAVREIYPQWWGAVGDGVADDVGAFNAARDALSNGGIIFLAPDMIFGFESPFVIDKNNITLMGGGMGSGDNAGSSIIWAIAGFPPNRGVIEIDSLVGGTKIENTVIQDIDIYGAERADFGLFIGSSRMTEISRVSIRKCPDNCIRMSPNRALDVNQLLIKNIFLDNSGEELIRALFSSPNQVTDLHVSNFNLWDSSGDGARNQAVTLENVSSVKFERGFIAPFDTDVRDAFYIVGNNATKTSANVTIEDVICEQTLRLARIETVAGNKRVHTIRINNCRKYDKDTGPHVEILDDGVDGLFLSGNDFIDTSKTATTIQDSSGLGDTRDVVLIGNSFFPGWERESFSDPNNVIFLSKKGYNELGTPTGLTVAGGVITVSARSYYLVDGEGDANDNLDTINGFVDGMILILQAEDDAVTITIRDNSVGGGNIETEGNVAITLDDVEDKAYLFYDATNSVWVEISRFTG